MKIEVKQRTVMPLRYRSTGKYNELLAACRNLRETEALQVEPDSGQSVKSLVSGVTSFVVVQDATSLWVSRKVSAASPAAPEQNGRTAVPFGGAPVAVGR